MSDKNLSEVVDQLLAKPIIMQMKSCHPRDMHLLIDACSAHNRCYVQVRNCFHRDCRIVSDDFASAIDEVLWNAPALNGVVCNVLGVVVLAVPTGDESIIASKVATLVTRGYSVVLFNEQGLSWVEMLVENTQQQVSIVNARSQ